jgi:hypothetical protein
MYIDVFDASSWSDDDELEEALSIKKKIKQYSYKQVSGVYQRLLYLLCSSPHLGMEIGQQAVDDLSIDIAAEIKWPKYAVTASLSFYIGKVLSFDAAKSIAWSLAGNADRIHKGLAVELYRGQTAVEWVYVDLEAVRRIPDQDDVAEFVYRCIGGGPAGREVHVRQDIRFKLLSQAIGFGIGQRDVKYITTPRALVGMHTYLKLVPREHGTLDTPRVVKSKTSEVQKKLNRKLLRDRVNPSNCPFGYKLGQIPSCMSCDVPRFDRTKRCPMATRCYRRVKT